MSCPGCKSAERVGLHGFRDAKDYVARRVTALCLDYYILSCRLICWSCKEVAAAAKADAKAKAEAAGLRCEDATPSDEDEEEVEALTKQYTFMAHNTIGLELLPFSIGMRFPAFLTYRGAVDKVAFCPAPLSSFLPCGTRTSCSEPSYGAHQIMPPPPLRLAVAA